MIFAVLQAWSGLVNIVLNGINRNTDHILGANFFQDLFPVVFNSACGISQLGGDLLAGIFLADQFHDLNFPGVQCRLVVF